MVAIIPAPREEIENASKLSKRTTVFNGLKPWRILINYEGVLKTVKQLSKIVSSFEKEKHKKEAKIVLRSLKKT